MAILELTGEQVARLVKQLPPAEQENILRSLLAERGQRWIALAESDERRIGSIAAQRGRDWNVMTEEEREDFIQELCEED